MKKLFLLLTSLILSAHAITCLEASNSISVDYPGTHDEYKIDKAIGVNQAAYDYYYYSTVVFHRDNEGAIDSATRCVGDLDSCEQAIKNNLCNESGCRTFSYKEILTKDPTNHTITSQQVIGGDHPENTRTYYLDKDSIHTIYFSDATDSYLDTSISSITYIRNDTLYGETYEYDSQSKSFTLLDKGYTIMDSTEKNSCNVYATVMDGKAKSDTLISKTWIEETGNSLIIYSIYNLEHPEYINREYYSLRNDEGTTIITKHRPTVLPRKLQYFDLIGRPAKGKHIIRIAK